MALALAEGLAELPGVRVEPVETNIVAIRLGSDLDVYARVVAGLRERGVLVSQLTPDMIRMVTHRHITAEAVRTTLAAVAEVLQG